MDLLCVSKTRLERIRLGDLHRLHGRHHAAEYLHRPDFPQFAGRSQDRTVRVAVDVEGMDLAVNLDNVQATVRSTSVPVHYQVFAVEDSVTDKRPTAQPEGRRSPYPKGQQAPLHFNGGGSAEVQGRGRTGDGGGHGNGYAETKGWINELTYADIESTRQVHHRLEYGGWVQPPFNVRDAVGRYPCDGSQFHLAHSLALPFLPQVFSDLFPLDFSPVHHTPPPPIAV